MQEHETTAAARRIAAEFGIVNEQVRDELASDERFAAAAFLHEQAQAYVHHEDSVDADREAAEKLEEAVHEHGRRVIGADLWNREVNA